MSRTAGIPAARSVQEIRPEGRFRWRALVPGPLDRIAAAGIAVALDNDDAQWLIHGAGFPSWLRRFQAPASSWWL